MKLSEWTRLFAVVKEHFPDSDPEVRFSDYDRRGFPELDLGRPVEDIDVPRFVCDSGIVRLPLSEPRS